MNEGEADPGVLPTERFRKKKLIAFVALVVFVGFGVLFFGPRMPREMMVRFELPPMLRGDGQALERSAASRLSARVFDGEGLEVGALDVNLKGLSGPRTGASVMNLKPGLYRFVVEVAGPGQKVPMHAEAELEGGEAMVDLKAGRRP